MTETKSVFLPCARHSAKCSVYNISLYSHKILSGGYAEYYHFIDEALERLINFTRIPRDYWAHGIWIQVLYEFMLLIIKTHWTYLIQMKNAL